VVELEPDATNHLGRNAELDDAGAVVPCEDVDEDADADAEAEADDDDVPDVFELCAGDAAAADELPR
jgi:hypothetical protein